MFPFDIFGFIGGVFILIFVIVIIVFIVVIIIIYKILHSNVNDVKRKSVETTNIYKASNITIPKEEIKQETIKKNEINTCKYCGEEIEDKAVFCPFCGSNLSE